MCRTHGRVIALAAAVATSGCSLINPYVRVAALDDTGAGAAGVPASAAASPYTVSLQSAVDLASRQRTAYYDAVGDRAKVRNSLPLVLIPLSAAALYKGVTSDGGTSARNLLLKEGLVGASFFGLGSYYTSSTREQVYLAGAKALSCSIYAVTPYFLPDALETGIGIVRQGTVRGRVQAVQRGAQTLRDALSQAVGQEPTLAGTGAVTFADSLLLRARKSVDGANKTLLRAAGVQASLADAPARLRATVENIVNQVGLQLSTLEPDPATILTLTAGLGATAKKFAPGADFSRAGSAADSIGSVSKAVAGDTKKLDELLAPAKAAAQQLALAVDSLDDDADALQFAADLVARRLQSAPSLDTCQVQSVRGRIDVSPPETEVEMRPGESHQFTVRSTVGIPSVEWVGSFAAKGSAPVVLSKQVAGNTLLVVATYEKQVPGMTEVEFEIADAALQLRTKIKLKLGEAEVPKPAMAASAPEPAASAVVLAAPPKAPVVPPPKPVKPPTVAVVAVPAPAASAASGPAGAPSAPQPVASPPPPAPTAALQPPGPQNVFEQGLTADQIRQMQAKLKLPATGTLDSATRAAVAAWQVKNKLPERNGSLGTASFARLMAS